ncbi:MAG: M20 family metallo-hydrolase [Bacteroidales bacterium]|nr:M20 family metallo-hydrolase [Bacteroidales bacterium]
MFDIDEIYYDAIDLLKAMVKVPSFSREETAVADVVETAMKRFGLNPKRFENNLWCQSPDFDPAKPTILLNAHIDTVKVAEGWQHDPFAATEEDGAIYGLGTNDDGASVVSLMAAYRALSAMPQPYNLIFLASAEEEVSGKNGVEAVLPMLPRIDFALVGEPTGMQTAIAEKGLMVLDGEIAGVAGHAARNEGVNAIYKAIDVINTLRNFRFEKESEMLGPVKISVTKIEAGRQHNVVPDKCTILVDVRTTDAYSNAETLDILRRAVPECTLTAHSTRLNPSGISPSHPVVARAEMLGKTTFGSPTLSDQALMPFPSLKMGPGDSARSHTADEYILLTEIRQAIDEYIVVLNGLTL